MSALRAGAVPVCAHWRSLRTGTKQAHISQSWREGVGGAWESHTPLSCAAAWPLPPQCACSSVWTRCFCANRTRIEPLSAGIVPTGVSLFTSPHSHLCTFSPEVCRFCLSRGVLWLSYGPCVLDAGQTFQGKLIDQLLLLRGPPSPS